MMIMIFFNFLFFPYFVFASELETTSAPESDGVIWLDWTDDLKNLLLTSCGVILDTESNFYSALSESIDNYLVYIGYKSGNTLKVNQSNGNISFDSALIQSLRNYMKIYNSDIYYLTPENGNLEDGFNFLFNSPNFTVEMGENMVNDNCGIIDGGLYVSLNDFAFCYLDDNNQMIFCDYNLETVNVFKDVFSGIPIAITYYFIPDFNNNTFDLNDNLNLCYGLELKVYSSRSAIASERLNPSYYITTNAPDQRSYDNRTYNNFDNSKYQTFYNNTDNSITDLGTYNYYTYNETVSTSFESTLNDLLESSENIENNTNEIINQLNDVIELLQEHSSYLENIDNTTSDIKGLVKALVGLEVADLLEDLLDDLDNDSNSFNNQVLPLMKTKFPFSLPWDVLGVFALLRHDPVTPSFTIHLYISSINFGVTKVVNFDDFLFLSTVSRSFLSLTFCIFLIMNTKRFL